MFDDVDERREGSDAVEVSYKRSIDGRKQHRCYAIIAASYARPQLTKRRITNNNNKLGWLLNGANLESAERCVSIGIISTRRFSVGKSRAALFVSIHECAHDSGGELLEDRD